jgi:hypothetical protein
MASTDSHEAVAAVAVVVAAGAGPAAVMDASDCCWRPDRAEEAPHHRQGEPVVLVLEMPTY